MKNVYTVAQVNSYIRNMFTQDFMLNAIYVKGEISNCKYHSSGHIYFTLKDDKGTIACVMFAGNRSNLKFRLEEGQQVIVFGNVDVYERDGKYQLYAKEIKLDGEGELYVRFEQLKRELEEMGMFSAQYKQKIPKYIRTLGVVTAPTGAAVRDIINITTRRNPYVQIILYPAIVQGDQAAASIVNGIHALEKLSVDVMIVGRGGGSLEDLWAFNEREVAQAVFNCSVPVISAVGHETDTTMIDYVADLRAPTPSAAAELAVFEIDAYWERLRDARDMLERRMTTILERKKMQYEQYELRIRKSGPAYRITQQRTGLMSCEDRLSAGMARKLEQSRHRLELYIEKFKGLSPIEKLNHGFSYVTDQKQNAITDVSMIEIGDPIRIHVKNGELTAEVTQIMKKDDIWG